MISTVLPVALLSLASSVLAVPTYKAGGDISQNALSAKLSSDGIKLFQLANFLENLEVDFFKQGAKNYTDGVWKSGSVNGVRNIDVIMRIAEQEQVHAQSITSLLQSNGAQAVEPCQYNFPVVDEESFLALASIITNVGIGALIDLDATLAYTDSRLEGTVASILPVESRHDAFFRLFAGEVPNPTAFDTAISGIWAYNLALDFVVTGSCGAVPQAVASLPIYPDLTLEGMGEPSFANPNAPGSLQFKIGQENLMHSGWKTKKYWIGWVNEDNAPVYTMAKQVVNKDGVVFTADVPHGLFGMAYAVLTDQNQATTVGDLTMKTVAGPLPIPLGAGNIQLG